MLQDFENITFNSLRMQDFELTSQLKSWYILELFDALKLVDPRADLDTFAQELFQSTTVNILTNYDVGMHWPEYHLEFPNYYFSALVL